MLAIYHTGPWLTHLSEKHMVPLKTWLLLLLFSLYVVSIYISHELAQSLLSNNMANLTKSSELVAEVKRRLANNVYPGQSSPYINTTLKQSTRHKGQSNQWGQDAPTPKIERRNMRISGYNDGSKYNPGPGITASWAKVSPNGVAVSDRSIPMGSTVYVNGKKYTVTDKTHERIGKELGDTIDIWSDEPTKTIIKRWVSRGDVQIIKKNK